jgi:hypothetical protein
MFSMEKQVDFKKLIITPKENQVERQNNRRAGQYDGNVRNNYINLSAINHTKSLFSPNIKII